VLVINNGEIVEQGTHQELLDKKRLLPPFVPEPVQGAGDLRRYQEIEHEEHKVSRRKTKSLTTAVARLFDWPAKSKRLIKQVRAIVIRNNEEQS